MNPFDEPEKVTADWMVHYMGRGINLGNTFEFPLNATDYHSVKTVVDAFITAGFTHIRIPINWNGRSNPNEGKVDANGNIDFTDADLQTVKSLLDYVLYEVNPQRLEAGLPQIILIVNTHHEDWAMDDLIGTQAYESNISRLERVWEQMCDFFSDYPDT